MTKNTKDETETSTSMPAGADMRQRRRKSSLEVMANSVAANMPEKIRPLVRKVGPLLSTIAEFYANGKPYFNKARETGKVLYGYLAPYHPEEWGPMLFGLTLCFFGGCFATTIAAWEAFRASGYYTVKDCLKVIYRDHRKVMDAWKKDDEKDENHDGKRDVDQLPEKELARRKFLLIVRTVDPAELGKAIGGINMGFLAVIAALRVKLAQAITLGSALGHTANRVLSASIVPDLEKNTSKDYRKWVRPMFEYGCKIVGFMLAMTVWRALMAVHSATAGSRMACEGLLAYLVRHKYIKVEKGEQGKGTKEFVMATTALAIVGFYWQLRHGFGLPFPLNLLLLPMSFLESFLGYFVAY